MPSSPGRILTTHVGSLPRPQELTDMLFRRAADEPVDPTRFEATVAEAVMDAVRRQKRASIDIPSDGEMSKISYATYVSERLTGFSGDSPRRVPADLLEVPRYMKRLAATGGTPSLPRPCCTGAIEVRTTEPLEADLSRFAQALQANGYTQGFMNAAAPGVISLFQPNRYYKSDDAYLEALSKAMTAEYRRIVEAGLYLQIDSPDLGVGRHTMYADLEEDEFIRRLGGHVAALNAALAGIPKDRVRLHLCWGNYEGPHTRDIPLARILPTVLEIHAGAISFEAANPRHAHEWVVFRETRLPEDRILIPGVIDSSTNFVEHPDLVAERLCRFADVVGRERVMAGTDCGFATVAGWATVDPDIVWMKLEAMAEGASRASRMLWKH
ncbi:MAG: cobalamin-independent methionine synthase II family protein [Proteobacteria bacterium]|nr:cobalamin-independent methionine synthase II family protein [Pseudomonadota bacterium]MBI3496695.1 cobalamin-independent methionine synthase II family protein [Pseudomonadota bacterium]